ncbi:MAG: hypothetical protein M3N16_01510 [Actinomycetota bacterium]|nr:hypothetical protein [Actinomycetota bacterium]
MATALTTFVLGALFGVALQFLAARLALMREQARESWIRRLNSYQDFNTATVALAELWQAGVDVPKSHVWDAIAHARKAAYDAALYDKDRPTLTRRMRDLSGELARLSSEPRRDRTALEQVIAEAEAIWDEFARSDPALQEGSRPRWLPS